MTDTDAPYLIVGLGNPGEKYLFTRHNIGFIAIDWIFNSLVGSQDFKNEKKSFVAKAEVFGKKIFLVKPQTFMNLSGEAVQALMAYYKVPKKNILILQDDLAMPYGSLRFMFDRSPGGHNGIKDIHQKIGSDYARLKIGIDAEKGQIPVDKFVLMNFTDKEQDYFTELLDYIKDSTLYFIEQGLEKASNQFNRKKGFA